MVPVNTCKQMAMQFEEVSEQPHFHKLSYRTAGRIFATLDEKSKLVSLKLSEVDQSVFCSFDHSIFYPATGKWGQQGWTIVELNKVPKQMLADALTTAYNTVASKKR